MASFTDVNMMPFTMRSAAIAATLGTVIVNIGAGVSQAPQLPGRVVEVTGRDYFFEAPDTIDAGVVTLRLWHRGETFHNLELVRLDSGHTLAEWHRAAGAHRLPAWATNFGGPGFAPPGRSSNATFLLQPGNYLLTCSVGSARTVDSLYHVWRGMIRPLHVRPAQQIGQLPRPDITARITDSGVEFSGALQSGRRVVRVENAGSVVHEFTMSRVLPGHTAAEAIAWRRRMGTPPPDVDIGGVADLQPGRVLLTTLLLEPGEHIAQTLPGRGSPGAQTVVRIRAAGER